MKHVIFSKPLSLGRKQKLCRQPPPGYSKRIGWSADSTWMLADALEHKIPCLLLQYPLSCFEQKKRQAVI